MSFGVFSLLKKLFGRPLHSVRYSMDSSVISGNLWFSDLYFELYGMSVNYFSVFQFGSGDVSILE